MKALIGVIDRVAAQRGDMAFSVRLWNGERRTYGTGPEDVAVRLKDRRTALGLLANPSLRFGEAYVAGDIEVEGDLGALMELLLRVARGDLAPGLLHRGLAAVTRWARRNSPRRSRRHVAHHYDLGNDFFALWLGETMAYSCAYFRHPSDDLDTAQEQKFRHLCEKLRLEPGQTLLDVGCGWGGLAAHAAAHHGVNVVGITLSEAQKRHAEAMIAARGLGGQVEIRLADYRELRPRRPFDRIVSVGMFEHVGQALIPAYMAATARLLADGGVGVLHTIGRMAPAPIDPWIGTHVFPGAYFPSLGELAEAMGDRDLAIADVEAWRLHYALTLDRWSEAFEEHAPAVAGQYGERFVRMWRLYLRSSAAAFRVGNLTVWQIQFTRGENNNLPLTRDYLSAARTEAAGS
ncbi:MAG TPA: cyclopropane-fatty-acyl-phospholipid synthase family protein [Candidatus Binatia bacterium]|nr:cyclopropane-fatty-acyl-phospholipid synthase family protein [Candidatus Binatia bacterium]